MKKILLATCYLLLANCINAQLSTPKQTFTKADTLRGSNNEYRNWWDVLRYEITVKPDFEKKEIEGVCKISFKSNVENDFFWKNGNLVKHMQIDLQAPMHIDSFIFNNIHSGFLINELEDAVFDIEDIALPISNRIEKNVKY